MELKSSFPTQQAAVAAANKLKGHEAIKQEADGSFGVYSLSAEEKKQVDSRDFSKFTQDIVSFSIDQPKGADKVVDRISEHQYKSLEAAREAAAAHPGNETIARNDNGTLSMIPFVDDDKVEDAEGQHFSKFAANTREVAIQGVDGKTEFIEAVDARGTELAENAKTLMDNIHANQAKLGKKAKSKPNQYVLGGNTVDIAGGKVAADCSGFLKGMYAKVGVDFTPRTAEDIGRMVRSGKGPFRQIKHGADIRPGDVLSFSLPERTEITGHAMMAVGKPEPIQNAKGQVIGYNLRIIDSTSRAHGDDTDHGNGKSGAGMGTITVGVDKNDKVISLSWGKNFEMYDYKHEVTVGRIK